VYEIDSKMTFSRCSIFRGSS